MWGIPQEMIFLKSSQIIMQERKEAKWNQGLLLHSVALV